MKIGVPTEIKTDEHRVSLTPAGVRELTNRGHQVLVQQGAGLGSSLTDDEYSVAGATLVADADAVWADADMVVKVKEPVGPEHARMRRDQVLFTYLHLAASRECTDAVVGSGTTAIAYETVQRDRSLPLLAPMSEVAGRLAPQVGARALEKVAGGRGVLLGGVPGVRPASVVVIGAGVSGYQSALIAAGMLADVTLLDIDLDRLRSIAIPGVTTVASNKAEIENAVLGADLVIGAVLVPGAKAPTLVSNELVQSMKPGSVLVDIAIDQGGCFEDSRPTTHSDPTYTVGRSVFSCVANLPGAVPHTSTFALTNATLPYVVRLADLGWEAACAADPALALGLNAHRGALTNASVAEAHGLAYEMAA